MPEFDTDRPGSPDVIAGAFPPIAAPAVRVSSPRLVAGLAMTEVAKLQKELAAVTAERDRLRDAIRTHRAQKADDRCIEDDDRLYAALGDGVPCDRRVGCQAAMLANCKRFIENRTEGGGWPTYAELEAERNRLRAFCEVVEGELRRGVPFDDNYGPLAEAVQAALYGQEPMSPQEAG